MQFQITQIRDKRQNQNCNQFLKNQFLIDRLLTQFQALSLDCFLLTKLDSNDQMIQQNINYIKDKLGSYLLKGKLVQCGLQNECQCQEEQINFKKDLKQFQECLSVYDQRRLISRILILFQLRNKMKLTVSQFQNDLSLQVFYKKIVRINVKVLQSISDKALCGKTCSTDDQIRIALLLGKLQHEFKLMNCYELRSHNNYKRYNSLSSNHRIAQVVNTQKASASQLEVSARPTKQNHQSPDSVTEQQNDRILPVLKKQSSQQQITKATTTGSSNNDQQQTIKYIRLKKMRKASIANQVVQRRKSDISVASNNLSRNNSYAVLRQIKQNYNYNSSSNKIKQQSITTGNNIHHRLAALAKTNIPLKVKTFEVAPALFKRKKIIRNLKRNSVC